MRLVDTHAHMGFPTVLKDIEGAMARAEEKGVGIVNCCLSPQELEATRGFEQLYLTIGCTPYRLQDFDRQHGLIEENIDVAAAVGEIGLDYHWVKENGGREKEKENFIKLLDLAKQHDKPVLVHSRNAEKPALDILEKSGARAIMHCFSGSLKEAERAIGLGYLISVPANVVRSRQKQEFARKLPLESIVLETDSPYLAPEPKTVNEPANVAVSARKIADLREISFEEVAEQTTKNARDFFEI